jgi:hypothetical protein
MHGKVFLLERAYAGIDEHNCFLRLDFSGPLQGDHNVELRIEVLPESVERSRMAFLGRFLIAQGRLVGKELIALGESGHTGNGAQSPKRPVEASFDKVLRLSVPLGQLGAQLRDTLLLRFTISREELPLDSLPAQGWMELPIISEEQMVETGDQVW